MNRYLVAGRARELRGELACKIDLYTGSALALQPRAIFAAGSFCRTGQLLAPA